MLTVLPIGLFIIASEFDDLIRENYDQDIRLKHTLELIEARETVEGLVIENFLMLGRLAAFMEANPELNQSQFERIVISVGNENDLVINYAAAPDLIVKFVHPLETNRSAIGLDYSLNDAQHAGVVSALKNQAATIVGPVDLVQGGRGLIIRQPVFEGLSGSDETRELWGVVSVVLDYDRFWAASGVMDLAASYDLFVTSDFDGDSLQEVVFGDPAVSENRPIELEFDFPTGSWKLLAVPVSGWPTHSPNAVRIRFVMALISAILIFAVLTIGSLALSHQTARRRLSAAVDAMDDGFAMFDRESRLVASNKRYAEIYDSAADRIKPGVYFEDILRLAAENGMHASALGRETDWVQERMACFEGPDITFEQSLCDGRYLLAADRNLADGGKVSLRTDITQLKRAQEKAEAASKAKSEFISTLSHELRTPLTVILGVTGLLKESDSLEPVRRLTDELQRSPIRGAEVINAVEALLALYRSLIEKQERSAKQMLALVNDVLDMAKVESGSLDVNFQRYETAEILNNVQEQLAQRAHEKGLDLEIEKTTGYVYCDRLRTIQILLNLTGNAIKFTESGKVSVSVTHSEQSVTFEVSDTGHGISATDQENIFVAFKQLDSSDTRAHGGVGLGLAISRRLAELQGAHLEVFSEIGVGSRFVLRFPARREAEVARDKTGVLKNEW